MKEDLKTLNMREIAAKVIEKNPYRIAMQEKSYGDPRCPATEKHTFYNILYMCVNKPGASFTRFPQSRETGINAGRVLTYSFINKEGDIVETVPPSQYANSEADYKIELSKFKFKTDRDCIIVAIMMEQKTHDSSKKGVLFLSKAFTIGEMQDLRDEQYSNIKKKDAEASMKKIKMIWA